MSDLKVCRICLCKGVKLYHWDSFHLKQYYEEIMAKKVNERDALPNYFCYECAAILYKFHKFKEKCWMGENALQELLWSGPITLSSISQIYRQDKNLQSPIGIISVNNRVRTQLVKHKPRAKDQPEETKKDEITDSKIGDESDKTLDDNLAEIKIEITNVNDCKEDEKTNIEDITEEKAMPEVEDGRNFSDDEDLLPESTDDAAKPDIKEQINNEITVTEQSNLITEQANSDNELVLENNLKRKKKKETRKDSLDKKKGKKYEVVVGSVKSNYLDPKDWLKINLTEDQAMEEFKAKAQDRKYLTAAYKCSDCFKGFSKEDMLNRHIKLRHNESLGPIECRFCKMRFKWKCFLSRHITQHYTKFKCLRCDLICPLETTAVFHNEYHNGVIRKCTHCGDEFRHPSTYYTHLRTHRSEHVCTLCGASFVSTLGLGIHKRTMHVNTIVTPEEDSNTYCNRCDIKFETLKAYDEHVFHSAKHAESIEDLETNAPITSNPRKRRQNLKRLTRIPTDCHICGKHFATQAACRKHHLAEHPRTPFFAPNERHICEICGMSLAPGSVSSHLNTHTREKLYTCNTCGRQFSSKGGMTTHQLTHTSEKPVACTLCDKRFKQVSSMKLHYRTYHLKEPYPKRNRKKKTDELSKDEYGHEDSDENMTLDNFYARKY